MNKIYKVIWSKVKHQYVVVSELAHRDGKRSSIAGKSVKTMLAVCALCSAVMFGGYGMPNVYAAGADTLPGQYIAIGGATTAESTANDGHWEGRWPNREWVVDTYYRDLEDASGTTHRYVYTQGNDGNYYWVREGYSIEIVENKRYPTADKNTVINTYKGANADSDGLVQSYQNVQENMNIGTLNGDTLFTTNTDMYGGAVNTSTTAITTGQNYRIEQNGRYIEAGLNNLGSYFNTEDVVYHENTGLYTFHGQVVGTENLYVIGGNVGVFTTTANGDTLYTGDVYGRNNEILMTAVDENGNLVSYWGAEIVDPNATIGSMTISTLEGKFDEVNKNIEKIHKDDIKEIQVAPTGTSTDGQGGTIGLQTNGAFDADGNPTGGKVIPGGITVTSIGGTNGKDVQVQFSNTDPDTKQTNSFTVNAGSKVVGKVGEVTATEGQTLDGISINGVDYKLGGGQNYTAGNNVHINGNVISADGTKVSADEGNFTVTPTTNEETNVTDYNIKLNNVVTVGSGENTKPVQIDGVNGQVTGLTNKTLDVEGFATSSRAATEEQLKLVQDGAANINLTNITEGGKTVIKGLEQHITPGEYKVQADGTVTMNYVDGNGQTITGQTAKITGIASESAVKAAKSEVAAGTNVDVTTSTGTDGQTVYTVNADGTTVSADEGNFTVTPTTNEETNVTDYNIKLNNVVTVGSGENTKPVQIDGVNGQVTGLTNKTLDVEGFATSSRAATEEQLKLVQDGAANINLTNITEGGKTVIKGLEQHITPGEYKVQADGTVTMNYVDGNGQTVTGQTAKITGIASESAVAAAKTTVSSSNNISAVGTQQADGHMDYNVKLNDNVYLGGDQTADNSNIALEGSTGSIHAATTKGNHTFDFDSNGGKFETTTVDDSLLVDMPIIGKNGVVTTTTNTSEFNQSGATFTKTGKVETYLGDQVITTTLIPKTFTNIDGSKITSDAGVLGGQTVVDGGSVTVQGAGSVLGTHTTTVEGSKITSVGTWGSLLGDTTEIDGAYINAGGIEVNGEPLRDTITGLSNTEWKNDEAWQKTHIRDDRAATEGQLQDVADSLSGDVSKLDDFAVKYDEVNGKPDYDKVTLEGKDGTKITNLAKGKVTATSTDAVNGSQLFEVQELAGKHTTMTVNNGMAAPENGSYTTDGNLQLKQKVGDKGQIEYDVKLNDNLVLGNGDSQITLNGAPTDENAPAISVGEVFTVGQDGSVHAAVAGDSTSDSMSFTNGGLTISNMSGDVSSATVIKGADIQAGGIHLDGTDKIIAGLSNTKWTGMTTTPDKAATEGQLQTVSDTVASGWTATDDKGYKINVNPNTHPTLNFASGKNVTVNAENDEINVALNDDIVLGGSGELAEEQDNRVTLSGTNGTIMATTNFNDMSATTTINGGNVYVGSSVSVGDTVVITDKDITGLSNTTWNGQTDDVSRAATEGQLKVVSDNVNAGWIATDNNGNEITVNPKDNTLNFSGDRNVTVEANKEDGSIDVSLNDDIVLGGKDGSTSRVQIGGTDGVITVTKDANDMGATTTIAGGDIYAGSSVTVGDTVKLTTEDITGLSNTTWDGTTDDVSRAATEGQLQTVADTVNAGWTATDDAGNKINVNPKDHPTLNFASGKNVTVSAADGEISVSLNDEVKLGDYDNGTGIYLSGASGTISATNSISVGEDLVIDGNKKTVNGLSNKTWSKDSFVSGQAATEDQLDAMADWTETQVNNSGWTASTNGGKKTEAITNGETVDFSNTDGNIKVSQDVTANGTSIKFNLNDDLLLVNCKMNLNR